MVYYRRAHAGDVYSLNRVNLDRFTENFAPEYYLNHIATWPELCWVAETVDGGIAGYIFARMSDASGEWFGHVTALSVGFEYRGMGIATKLMDLIEQNSFLQGATFVDLFVRPSNSSALTLYKKRGYIVHETLPEYYSDMEAAKAMRLYRKKVRSENKG